MAFEPSGPFEYHHVSEASRAARYGGRAVFHDAVYQGSPKAVSGPAMPRIERSVQPDPEHRPGRDRNGVGSGRLVYRQGLWGIVPGGGGGVAAMVQALRIHPKEPVHRTRLGWTIGDGRRRLRAGGWRRLIGGLAGCRSGGAGSGGGRLSRSLLLRAPAAACLAGCLWPQAINRKTG